MKKEINKRGKKANSCSYLPLYKTDNLLKSKRSNSHFKFLFNKDILNSKRSQSEVISSVLFVTTILAPAFIVLSCLSTPSSCLNTSPTPTTNPVASGDPLIIELGSNSYGGAPYRFFGGSIDGSGDLNGDGYSDLIVGVFGWSNYTGLVMVYYGSTSGLNPNASYAENTASGCSGGNCSNLIYRASGYYVGSKKSVSKKIRLTTS